MSWLVKRSFSLSGHRTSVALEPAFWAVLERMAVAKSIPVSRLVADLDAARDSAQPLASALRIMALGSNR